MNNDRGEKVFPALRTGNLMNLFNALLPQLNLTPSAEDPRIPVLDPDFTLFSDNTNVMSISQSRSERNDDDQFHLLGSAATTSNSCSTSTSNESLIAAKQKLISRPNDAIDEMEIHKLNPIHDDNPIYDDNPIHGANTEDNTMLEDNTIDHVNKVPSLTDIDEGCHSNDESNGRISSQMSKRNKALKKHKSLSQLSLTSDHQAPRTAKRSNKRPRRTIAVFGTISRKIREIPKPTYNITPKEDAAENIWECGGLVSDLFKDFHCDNASLPNNPDGHLPTIDSTQGGEAISVRLRDFFHERDLIQTIQLLQLYYINQLKLFHAPSLNGVGGSNVHPPDGMLESIEQMIECGIFVEEICDECGCKHTDVIKNQMGDGAHVMQNHFQNNDMFWK